MSATSPKFSAAERATVWLVCSNKACGKKFHPKPSTTKGAMTNQCSTKCRISETKRRFGGTWSPRQRWHA